MNNTQEAAEIMHRDGGWHTAATLAAKMEITAMRASGLIYNIRHSKKYKVEETPLPNRKVKVVSIQGREHCNQSLLRMAIFGVKAA